MLRVKEGMKAYKSIVHSIAQGLEFGWKRHQRRWKKMMMSHLATRENRLQLLASKMHVVKTVGDEYGLSGAKVCIPQEGREKRERENITQGIHRV